MTTGGSLRSVYHQVVHVEGPTDWMVIILAIAMLTRLYPYIIALFKQPWATSQPKDLILGGVGALILGRAAVVSAAIASLGNTEGNTAILIGRTMANFLTILGCIPIAYALFGVQSTFRVIAASLLSGAVMAGVFYAVI